MALPQILESAREGVQTRYNKEKCFGLRTIRFLDALDKQTGDLVTEAQSLEADKERLTADKTGLEADKANLEAKVEKQRVLLLELPDLRHVAKDYEILRGEKSALEEQVKELQRQLPDVPRLRRVDRRFKVALVSSFVLGAVCLSLVVVVLSKNWDLAQAQVALEPLNKKIIDQQAVIKQQDANNIQAEAQVTKLINEKYDLKDKNAALDDQIKRLRQQAVQVEQQAPAPKMTDSAQLLSPPEQ